jgi:hypothetical protein
MGQEARLAAVGTIAFGRVVPVPASVVAYQG